MAITMLPATSGIYQIVNLKNGKVYVGSARDMRQRQWCHLSDLRIDKHCNNHLSRAYRAHGAESFEWLVLELVEGEAALTDREQHWISECRASDSRHGYNIVDVARRVFSMTGRRHTQEARAKITASQIGVTRASGEAMGMSKLTNQNIRDIRKLLADGYSRRQVGAALGVTKATIQCIADGRTWGHVKGMSTDVSQISVPAKRVLRGAEIGTSKLNSDKASQIRARLASGEYGRRLAVEFGVSESVVSAIRHGKIWVT